MSTEQKVIVVTGASQGIGAAILKAFRQQNHSLVATSRSMKSVDDPNILAVQGDVGDAETAKRVFNAALERSGRVDTLVNNAGMFMAKPFINYSQHDYAAYVATNVTGFHSISAAFLIACAANLGVASMKNTSAPKVLSETIWESTVGSVGS